MATPNSRTTFKNYCLRSLGSGVIDINVSDDQVDDRIDEALQYFAEYHYDGYERMYLKHLVTEADVTRARDNITTSVTDIGDGTTTADWLEGRTGYPFQTLFYLSCKYFLLRTLVVVRICSIFVISYVLTICLTCHLPL